MNNTSNLSILSRREAFCLEYATNLKLIKRNAIVKFYFKGFQFKRNNNLTKQHTGIISDQQNRIEENITVPEPACLLVLTHQLNTILFLLTQFRNVVLHYIPSIFNKIQNCEKYFVISFKFGFELEQFKICFLILMKLAFFCKILEFVFLNCLYYLSKQRTYHFYLDLINQIISFDEPHIFEYNKIY